MSHGRSVTGPSHTLSHSSALHTQLQNNQKTPAISLRSPWDSGEEKGLKASIHPGTGRTSAPLQLSGWRGPS